MASLGSTDESIVAIKPGSTWGTAADLTSAGIKFHLSNLTLGVDNTVFNSRDIGFGNFVEEVVKTKQSVSMTITADLSYHGAWQMVLASFMGDSDTPAEQNGGEGDYLHSLTMASNNDGNYLTIVYAVEDDYVLEFPSCKVTGITMQSPANDVGTFSATLMCDQVVDNASASNTYAEIAALSYPTYQPAVLGCAANHYLRVNDQSGGALSSGDDKEILSFNLSLTRPLNERFVLRGANSCYTLEPKGSGIITGQFSFQTSEIDDSKVDGFADFLAGTQAKAEVFIDGDQIASGDNASIKLELPSLYPLAPSGYDIPGNNSAMQPTFNYQITKASSTPTGMTDQTPTFECVDERSTSYV